jgi:subtilisin family serine protease
VKNIKIKGGFLLATLSSLIFGCHKIEQLAGLKDIKDKETSQLISTAPTNQKQAFYILQLQTPALLKGVVSDNGVLQIDEKRKEAILKEQEQVEGKLAEISKDIKVIYKYQLSLNAIYILAPIDKASQLSQIASIVKIEKASSVARPMAIKSAETLTEGTFQGSTSVEFIGGKKALEMGFTGKGIKVGVIDTGIDYTHAMLGGTGNTDDFKKNNPSLRSDLFPNQKVVGGIDLVGTKFNSASPRIEDSVPLVDENPMDEGGHGSHVAGTIAGLGDGRNSYSGVSPDADLYAIKVFGADGSTSDAVVIAAFEYALDPNHDLDPSDRLDVVNLSLGSSYGTPKILYNEAVQTASDSGLVVVASAGNAGHFDYIVGAPSTTDASISVAASVDDMNHNFIFDALKISIEGQPDRAIDFVEGAISKPLAEVEALTGRFVYIGLAGEISPEQAAELSGRIALIDRGQFPFSLKIKNVFDAGAIGAVVINSQDGPAFVMGGDTKSNIPAVMIAKFEGEKIKNELQKNKDVFADFKSGSKIARPELIDTLTDFSSNGPRSIDSAIKPEISAPGSAIVSAEMGGGKKTVKMSGTSMAAPHMSGVMALLKQKFRMLNSNQFKSVAMGAAKVISDTDKKVYPVSQQGAGRIQLAESLQARLVSDVPALSLGEVSIGSSKAIRKKLTIKNITEESLNLNITSKLHPSLNLTEQQVNLAVGESKQIVIDFKIQGSKIEKNGQELDGRVLFTTGDKTILQIPVLAIGLKTSELKAKSLEFAADSEQTAQGSLGTLRLNNASSIHSGLAIPFNLLVESERKLADNEQDQNKAMSCDLESVGYRVLDVSENGVSKKVLQIALKTFTPLTTWHFCETNVQIDANNDGIPDQELAGIFSDNISGFGSAKSYFASTLFNANELRALRKKYESEISSTIDSVRQKASEDYSGALVDQMPLLQFDHSTLNILQMDLSKIKTNLSQAIKIKVGIQTYESDPMSSFDIINRWYSLDPLNGQSFLDLPTQIELNPGQTQVVSLTKGSGRSPLVIYYPQNAGLNAVVGNDYQSEIIRPVYIKPE